MYDSRQITRTLGVTLGLSQRIPEPQGLNALALNVDARKTDHVGAVITALKLLATAGIIAMTLQDLGEFTLTDLSLIAGHFTHGEHPLSGGRG